jgi:hypothetical protein
VPENVLRRLLQVSGTGTVSGNTPVDGYTFTTEQLENARALNFLWVGRSTQYQFALYRTNGTVLIEPEIVYSPSFSFTDPQILTVGDYVWQIYEMDSQGRWGLPSTSNRFNVIRGQTTRIELPSTDQRPLYGNQ